MEKSGISEGGRKEGKKITNQHVNIQKNSNRPVCLSTLKFSFLSREP